MPDYRRSKTGRLFFFTVVTWKRTPLFHLPENRVLLGEIIRKVRSRYPFETEAFVLMPEHLHCIWRLTDTDYSMRWGLIKKEFTKKVRAISGNRDREVWQKRFWEHTIRDEEDFENHCHYIHFNPVKHGHARTPAKWEFSSFHRFVAKGLYPPYWSVSESVFEIMNVRE
jgi:putative transposase